MALVVEDGSQVTGANSYVSLDDARQYVFERGGDLSTADDSAAEATILKAMDYLESFAERFKGTRVSRDQSLSWPRSDVWIEEWYWNPTEIPRQVINAQMALIYEINAGEDPFNPPAPTTMPVVRTKVGPIEKQYAAPASVSKVQKTSQSSVHIRMLLKQSGLSIVRS